MRQGAGGAKGLLGATHRYLAPPHHDLFSPRRRLQKSMLFIAPVDAACVRNCATGNGHERGDPWPAAGAGRAQLASAAPQPFVPTATGRIPQCRPSAQRHLCAAGPPRLDLHISPRPCFSRTGSHAAPGVRSVPCPAPPHPSAPFPVQPGAYTTAAKAHGNACAVGAIVGAGTGEKRSADPRRPGALSGASNLPEYRGGGKRRTEACRIRVFRGGCA